MACTQISRRGVVRRALRLSTVEGILAEWVSACAGGGALIAWGLHLGASPVLVAILAALPAIAQSVQLPAARLTARLGARRTAVVASFASRQPYLLLVALPWLPLGPGGRQLVLTVLAALAAALGAVGQHGWLAWTTALFRPPIRARVLARRSGRVTLAGSAAALGVGAVLERSVGGARPVALAALAAVAWASGVAAAALLSRQPAPRSARRARDEPVTVREAMAEGSVRRGLRYVLAWNAAMGVVASASAVFMLYQLRLGLLTLALHGVAVAVGAAAGAPLWGRIVDRAGVRRVLVLSAAAAAALPFLSLAATERTLWPIAIEAVLGGFLLGGHGVAASNLPLEVARDGHRAEVLATYSSAAGLAFAAASVTSGLVTTRLPFALFVGQQGFVVRKLVLAAGGAARLGAAALATRVFRKRRGEASRTAP